MHTLDGSSARDEADPEDEANHGNSSEKAFGEEAVTGAGIELEEGISGKDGEEGYRASSAQRDTELPVWYTQGAYERNPSGSKKEPLLLDMSHLDESFIRGSGPGGQAINKLSTCVQLKHGPSGTVIKCQETRSRSQNRDIARRRMSRELEHLVFGERDSVLGREALRAKRKKAAKGRKQQRKEKEGDQPTEK